jgi:hypothetical protein
LSLGIDGNVDVYDFVSTSLLLRCFVADVGFRHAPRDDSPCQKAAKKVGRDF